MITATGYSKDISIMPEGIVVTFGRDMLEVCGGAKKTLQLFLEVMADDEDAWMHKCKNKPTVDVVDVYIICMNRLWGRGKFVGYETETLIGYDANGEKLIDWPRILIAGPFERCPFKRTLKGFEGFRYCTKLF